MITNQRSHYLPILASYNRILLLSDVYYEAFDMVKKYFGVSIQYNMQERELNNIHATISNNNINIILLDATSSSSNAKKFYKAIKALNKRIIIVAIFDDKTASEAIEFTHNSDTAIFAPFTLEEFKGKLFDILSIFYTILSIGGHNIKHMSIDYQFKNMNTFFDAYEGNLLFLTDELMEISTMLKNGELSHELLQKISLILKKIADIFLKNSQISALVPILNDLIDFLDSIDLNLVEPSKLKLFDYLVDIINDINQNMMALFINRTISDIKIFEYSIQYNNYFIKNLFFDKKTDISTLEYFND